MEPRLSLLLFAAFSAITFLAHDNHLLSMYRCILKRTLTFFQYHSSLTVQVRSFSEFTAGFFDQVFHQ